ncbi:MAG: hypothetical protein ACREA9_28260 [Pyrinomonadaceae bacterium]
MGTAISNQQSAISNQQNTGTSYDPVCPFVPLLLFILYSTAIIRQNADRLVLIAFC